MSSIPNIQKYLTEKDNEIANINDNIQINTMMENLIREITGAERASVWIYRSNSTLIRERGIGWINELQLSDNKSLLYKCFATKEAAIYNYITSEKGYIASIDNPDTIKLKSKIMVPLVENNRFIGIATAYSTISQIKNFTLNDLNILKAVAPSLINSICKIITDRVGSCPVLDRRSSDRQNSSGLQRRKTDADRRKTHTIKNLKEVEESRTMTQNDNELLDYVANIVHDIRTPSNSLYGFLEILEEKIEDTRLKQYVSHAKESAKLVNELTTSILDGVSSKRELAQSKPEKVSTFKFFAEIAEIFSSNMYKKRINYNIYIDPYLPKEITIESMKLKRIIINLIGNAYKFTKEGKSIEFSIRYQENYKMMYLHVADTGIGIVKEKQEQIFEAFEQAEDNTKEKYGGTGLGLAISAGYVKDLGGKLLVESKVDEGSRFYFEIPIETGNTTHKFQKINNPAIHVTILIENNNSLVANHIARYLVRLGIKVHAIDAILDSNSIQDNTTHLIVFENKLSADIHSLAEMKNIKMLIVEENFLSLKLDDMKEAVLISQYTYYADTLYTFLSE